MDITVHKMDEVWTSDNFRLGMAHCLYYRPQEQVRANHQLYAAYLEVINYDLGDDYYVPLEFLERVDGEEPRLQLTVPMKTVMDRTWSRAPEFVAKRQGRRVTLAYPDSEIEEQPIT